MKNQLISFLLIASIFSLGCGGNNTGSGSSATTDTTAIGHTDSTSVPSDSTTLHVTNITGQNYILFGDNSDGSCNYTGICNPAAGSASGVEVALVYTKGTGGAASIFQIGFDYASLYTIQPGQASYFYGTGKIPVKTYPFRYDFPISKFGGNFATIQATINAASPGTVTFTPVPATTVNPQSVNSRVSITFTVTTTP